MDGSTRGIGSARDALEQATVNRIRTYAGTMLAWCLLGIPLVVFTPAARIDRVLCVVAIAWLSIGYFVMYRQAVTPDTLRVEHRSVFWMIHSSGALVLALGLGLFSEFIGLITVGLILFSLAAPSRQAVAIYVGISVGYAVLGTLAIVGVLSPTGVLTPEPIARYSMIVNLFWAELVFATAFIVGRVATADDARLSAELERVVRQAAHREAMLREARAELERAAAIGGPGQFTDQELGPYRLAEVIGRGGMGEVYAAQRLDDGSEAAVKLMRRSALSDSELVRRFERETHIVRSLDSRHVVRVFDVGGLDAALPYIAMERLRGEDLATVLREKGMLSREETLTLVREVAAGLEAAHALGVVHRDLKPHNLYRAEYPDGSRVWKILDFGVSKLMDDDEHSLTANQIIGTPQYMAPEQARGSRSIDARADVYSLAVIAYRVITGQLAFSRGDFAQVMVAVLREMPEDPRHHRDHLPDDVVHALRIGLAKNPSDRFSSAAAMADAFEAAFVGTLDPALRARAHRLATEQPWGTANEDATDERTRPRF